VGGIELHGKMDRVDHSEALDGEVVIDYKATASSYQSRKGWETPRPPLPQLPLYAAYLQSEGKKVVGVAFGKLSTNACEWDHVAAGDEVFGKKKLPKWFRGSLQEQIAEWQREIERL